MDPSPRSGSLVHFAGGGGLDRPLRDLGGTERAFWLLDQLARFNGLHATRVRGPIDAGLLHQGLAWLQRRHPLLRVTVDGGRRFVATAAPIPLRRVEAGHDLNDLVEEELDHRFWPAVAPLWRLALLPDGDEHLLVLSHHHVVADATSGVLLLRDLLAYLAARLAGEGEPPVEPLPLRPSLWSELGPAARGARFLHAGRRFLARFLGQLWQRPRHLAVAPSPLHGRRTRLVQGGLDVAVSAALVERCRREGTSVQGALVAALLGAVAAELGLEAPAPLGCFSALSLRDQLRHPVADEVGLYISQLATVHRVSAGGGLWPLAREVKAQLAAAIADGEQFLTLPLLGLFIPFGPARAPRLARRLTRLSPATVGVTNLGRLPLGERYGPLTVVDHQIAVGQSVVGQLTAAALFFAGRLSINLLFVDPLITRPRAQALLAATLQRLAAEALS